MTNQELSDRISKVFWTLDSHVDRVLSEVLNIGTESYQQSYREEWLRRDHFAFWCHLDYDKRRKLIELSKEIYD